MHMLLSRIVVTLNYNLQEVHAEGSEQKHSIIIFNCSGIILYSYDLASTIILIP